MKFSVTGTIPEKLSNKIMMKWLAAFCVGPKNANNKIFFSHTDGQTTELRTFHFSNYDESVDKLFEAGLIKQKQIGGLKKYFKRLRDRLDCINDLHGDVEMPYPEPPINLKDTVQNVSSITFITEESEITLDIKGGKILSIIGNSCFGYYVETDIENGYGLEQYRRLKYIKNMLEGEQGIEIKVEKTDDDCLIPESHEDLISDYRPQLKPEIVDHKRKVYPGSDKFVRKQLLDHIVAHFAKNYEWGTENAKRFIEFAEQNRSINFAEESNPYEAPSHYLETASFWEHVMMQLNPNLNPKERKDFLSSFLNAFNSTTPSNLKHLGEQDLHDKFNEAVRHAQCLFSKLRGELSHEERINAKVDILASYANIRNIREHFYNVAPNNESNRETRIKMSAKVCNLHEVLIKQSFG